MNKRCECSNRVLGSSVNKRLKAMGRARLLYKRGKTCSSVKQPVHCPHHRNLGGHRDPHTAWMNLRCPHRQTWQCLKDEPATLGVGRLWYRIAWQRDACRIGQELPTTQCQLGQKLLDLFVDTFRDVTERSNKEPLFAVLVDRRFVQPVTSSLYGLCEWRRHPFRHDTKEHQKRKKRMRTTKKHTRAQEQVSFFLVYDTQSSLIVVIASFACGF